MERIISFLKKYNYVVVFLLLEGVAFFFMTCNTYYQSSHIVRWSNALSGTLFHGVGGISQYFDLRSQNEQLSAENSRLRARIAESYIYYNTADFTSSDSVFTQQFTYTEAKVVKNSFNKDRNYIMINKGRLQGVEPDQAVLSPQGIVGTVVCTTDNFATIMTVIHPNSRYSVRIKRTGTNGTLEWNGRDYRYASVVDIPTTHQLNTGDTIITSGLSDDFPRGVLVGFVSSLSSAPGSGFYNIKMRLSTDFNSIEHVYIIRNRYKAEQDTLVARTEKTLATQLKHIQ